MADSNLKGRIRSNRKSPISLCKKHDQEKVNESKADNCNATDSYMKSSLCSKEKSTK